MKQITLIFLLMFAASVYSQDNESALIPFPNKIKQGKDFFNAGKNLTVGVDNDELQFAANQLQEVMDKHFGAKPSVSTKGNIILQINPELKDDEAYILDINKKNIIIEGRTAAGVLYGVITLEQILTGDNVNTKLKRIQSVRIDDAPAYPYRALMLDPARHFLPVEDVKSYIDQMAKYKYNTLQLHLTDDQGWRVEIKSHPDLTKIGAFRNPKGGDNGPDNGFYTQEQLKDIVDYAKQRNIEIIPEIDIPGHTAAILTAYPDFHCDFMQDSIFIFGKTDNVMLSAANPKVYEVLDDIIGEVSEIFPSKKLHIGGDESAIKKNWAKSPEHIKMMEEYGYTKPEQLMNVFFGKVFESTKKHGVHPIMWCELDNLWMPANEYLFDYPQDVTLVTWRYGLTPKCIELTGKSGNDLILAPGEYCYLDYPQYKNDFPEFNNWGMPITTLQRTYEFDPTYNLPEDERNHMQGVMGTLWAEAIKDINRVNYMTWPRGLALSEAGWTKKENRNWDSFKIRLYPNITEMVKSGVSVRNPFEISENKR